MPPVTVYTTEYQQYSLGTMKYVLYILGERTLREPQANTDRPKIILVVVQLHLWWLYSAELPIPRYEIQSGLTSSGPAEQDQLSCLLL